MKTTDHQVTAQALRDVASRIVGGILPWINKERTIARLAKEHAAALIALRAHHEAHRWDPEYLSSVLFVACKFALKPLDRAEIELASKRGECSPLDVYDLDDAGESIL